LGKGHLTTHRKVKTDPAATPDDRQMCMCVSLPSLIKSLISICLILMMMVGCS